MDKKAAKLFKQLSDDNKDYLEKAYEDAKKSGKPLSTEEINSFLEIKEARRQIAHADEQWEKGKWAQQNVNPDIAKEYYDSYVDKHQKIIDRNKALHRESAFIKDKRVDLSGSGKNILDTSGILRTTNASMFPSWEDIKNLGTRAGEGIIKGLQYLDPFSSAYGSENKDSFIFPEKKYRTSNVYDDIGQHSERRIREKQFSENYDYDKGNFLGIDNIEPNFLDIDGIEPQDNDWLRDNQYEGNYINYKPEQAQTWLEKHNAAQRAYNDTTGLNTNYYAGSLHGNIDNAARVGRRNQSRIDNLLGDYIAGNNKMTSLGLKNRINQLGTQSQIDTFNQIQNQPSIDIRSEIVDDYGTGNTDVTAPTDNWSDTGGTQVSGFSDNDSWGGYIARGGMVKDAPRYRYAEGGIVNLLPKGAW
jgi:hypothetical protein